MHEYTCILSCTHTHTHTQTSVHYVNKCHLFCFVHAYSLLIYQVHFESWGSRECISYKHHNSTYLYTMLSYITCTHCEMTSEAYNVWLSSYTISYIMHIIMTTACMVLKLCYRFANMIIMGKHIIIHKHWVNWQWGTVHDTSSLHLSAIRRRFHFTRFRKNRSGFLRKISQVSAKIFCECLPRNSAYRVSLA
jgi:hypothetical protein